MPKNLINSCRSQLARFLAPMMVALSLIVSAQANAQALTQSQQTAVSNLSTASSDLKNQITLGVRSATNFSTAANAGYIVDPTASTATQITETQRTAYNTALATFGTTNFYTAQQYLLDQAAATRTQMQQAITDFSAAAVDLQKVVTVNTMLSGITDSQTARATQTAISSAGLATEVTTGQVAAFNTNISLVNSYATQTAAFLSAAKNTMITSNIDLASANYNKPLYQATANYAYANDALTVAFDQQSSIGFQGFLTGQQISAQQFFSQPQIYGGN